MKPKLIVLEGYFFVGEGDAKKVSNYPNLDRAFIDTDLFKFSVRKFVLTDLQVIKMERLYGSILKSVEVQGVVNTKGSLIPFFIQRQKAKALQNSLMVIEISQKLFCSIHAAGILKWVSAA